MELSEAVILAMFGSPVILALVNNFFNRKPNAKQLEKIEDIMKSLNDYKIEQATQAFSQINWRIFESGVISNYTIQEWHMLYNNLNSLVKEDAWETKLRQETIRARKIIQGE